MRKHPAPAAAAIAGACLAILLAGAASPERIPVDIAPVIYGGTAAAVKIARAVV